jgi:uncharacterized protein (DUF58 family)
LGKGWLLLAAALLLMAAIMQQGILLLVAILLFILYAVAQVWAKYALRRLEYSRHLSTTRAFFGDTVTLELSMANRKILPLPWVQVEEELDESLALAPDIATYPSHRAGRVVLTNIMPLTWYHRVKRIYQLTCLKRGYYYIGPTRIRCGDYFSFRAQETEIGDTDYLMVYPRILPIEQLGIPSRDPFGDLRLRRHLFQDPVRAATIRNYAPGDPLKRIHWKASARVGKLQTKVFEHTTSPDLALFLDVRTVKPPFWGEITQLLEMGTIAAASITDHMVHKGYRIGLYVNQPYPDSGLLVKIPPSSHPDQLTHILEALAMVIPTESVSFDKFVREEGNNLPWVSTVVAITAVPTASLISVLNAFRQSGRPVALITVGTDESDFSADGLLKYNVPAEIVWDKAESVEVNLPDEGKSPQPDTILKSS